MTFSVVSTFSGCGGSSLGYKVAGGRVLLAVEWDDDAVATYSRNFPDTPVYHGDIALLSVDEVLGRTGLKPGELDLLDGSPPCQGFSTSGKRQFLDGRNQLFKEYVRLLGGLRPKAFVMENVSGMVKGEMKVLFAEILRTLKGVGYRVSARLLNAMHYGVPQSRERMIFVGVRDDLGVDPTHPAGTARTVTFREACWDLRGNGPDDRMLPAVLHPVALTQPDTWTTDLVNYSRVSGRSGGGMSLKWACWDKVCGTIVKSEIGTSGTVHPDRERYLSLAELRRVASFPDDFYFSGRDAGIERIGNCVPPLLMKAVAAHIDQQILSRSA